MANAFATRGGFPTAPDLGGFVSLADTVWLTPPPAMPMSDADLNAFLSKMREMKQQALRDRALRGGSPGGPVNPEKDKEKQGPLDVKAHGYYEGDKLIAVREIRVFEVGNYRKRTYNTFPGGWPDNSLRMDNARVGKTYRVKVTWENGTSQEKDVAMDSPNGTSVDVWKY
ncbi:MAG: hypothetical protein FJX76_00340 [Armatimonadetes bacterium]|nr:hypothetical protein [Armatimonadota bacterium]